MSQSHWYYSFNKVIIINICFTYTAIEGIAFDEIVVESSLNVRKKPATPARRQQRSTLITFPIKNDQFVLKQYIRQKRQYKQNQYRPQRPSYNNNGFANNFNNQYAGFGGAHLNNHQYGSSASSANANSQSHGFGQNGFNSAAAQAQAQGFQAQGPSGGFGASAANTATQSFQAGSNGLQV